MGQDKIRLVGANLDVEKAERFAEHARKEGLTTSDLVRRLIDEELNLSGETEPTLGERLRVLQDAVHSLQSSLIAEGREKVIDLLQEATSAYATRDYKKALEFATRAKDYYQAVLARFKPLMIEMQLEYVKIGENMLTVSLEHQIDTAIEFYSKCLLK